MPRVFLEDNYNTKQALKMLNNRYGLNPLGIKKILNIDTKRFNELNKGEDGFSEDEVVLLTSSFEELIGKIDNGEF